MNEINSLAEVPQDGIALLYLGTSWCTYCQKTRQGLSEVLPGLPEVQLVHIDGDEEPDVLGEVGAKTYPQLLLYRDGRKVAQRESADGPELSRWLDENGVS